MSVQNVMAIHPVVAVISQFGPERWTGQPTANIVISKALSLARLKISRKKGNIWDGVAATLMFRASEHKPKLGVGLLRGHSQLPANMSPGFMPGWFALPISVTLLGG